ncbi:MAG: proline--tRNA ligase [Mycoplasmatota bacterium]
MKLKNSFFYTLRENVKDEDSVSGNLLVRSGMIKKSSSGVYMYMPLGLKVLKNIENIIREEMNKTGANEVLMPSLVHEDIYEKSGRTKLFGDSVFKLKDRYKKPYVLGPTHEELFVIAASMKIKSYKDMPFNIYQIQNKFRDEARPRYGLIRVREFVMKDAYSFDTNLENLDVSYKKMYNAYIKSFDRMNIKYRIVKADTGVMGGLLSEEFQAITPIGEDDVIYCPNCDFSSNLEVCECHTEAQEITNEKNKYELVSTMNQKTIKEVSQFLNIPKEKFVKSLVYKIDDELVMCLLRGDRELNETKVLKLLKATNISLASQEEINTFSEVGFIGPIDVNIKIIVDKEVSYLKDFIVGANKVDYHYINVNINDIKNYEIADIRNVEKTDLCPKCKKQLEFTKGIEIGNTFKLGTKYSNSLNLNYVDEFNKLNEVYMGCYGIGIGRCMASIIEQNNDEFGIKWPINIAPYKVALVVVNTNDENQMNYANELYNELNNLGIDTLLDDRNERVGVKFKDMDLIGIPYKIVIGSKLNENIVELKGRNSETKLIDTNEIINEVKERMRK